MDNTNNYLGGESIAGGKMKETGTTHWAPPNTGATNSSGFTALPGGYRDVWTPGIFYSLTLVPFFWSSTEYIPDEAWIRNLLWDNTNVERVYPPKSTGFSVRCLKD